MPIPFSAGSVCILTLPTVTTVVQIALRKMTLSFPQNFSIEINTLIFVCVGKHTNHRCHHVQQIKTVANVLSKIYCREHIKCPTYQHLVEFAFATTDATDCGLLIAKMLPHTEPKEHLPNIFQPNSPFNTACIYPGRLRKVQMNFNLPERCLRNR